MLTRKDEQKKFLKVILVGLILFMTIPIVVRYFHYSHLQAIINFVLLFFFILLYSINKKIDKPELISHVLIIGLLFVLTFENFMKEVKIIEIFWLWIIPIFSYLLLSMKQATIYSFITFIILIGLILTEPESMNFEEKYHILELYLFSFGVLYLFSKSRQTAWLEVEKHVSNLEDKVQVLLKEELEKEKLLIQTSKMASLGELLSNIAHQWKQPISIISVISINLTLDEELSDKRDEERLKLLRDLNNQVEFMTETMDDFRSFFKAKDELAIFEISTASYNLINLLIKNFDANNIMLNIENTENSIEVTGIENMYKQALLNIISNSIDAIKMNNSENTHIDILFDKDDQYGKISIQDYAGGIPNEILHKIFDKHFTTKGEKGSGIGLAMTKEIIEDFCHGKLEVENINGGARFTIFMPLNIKS